MPNNFSVVLEDAGNVVSPAVLRATPSPLGNILGSVSGGLNSFLEDNAASKKRRADAKKAADSERDLQAAIYTEESVLKASAQFRENEKSLFDVFRPSDSFAAPKDQEAPSSETPGMRNGVSTSVLDWDPSTFLQAAVENDAVSAPELEKVEEYVSIRADDAENNRAAVSQGTLSSLSASAAIEEIIQDVRQQFPGVHPDVISGVLAKLNVDKLAFMELQMADKEAREMRGQGIDYKKEMYSAGLSLVGPVGASQLTEEQIIMQGAAHTQTLAKLKMTMDEAELNSKLISNQEALNKMDEAKASKETEDVVIQGIYSALSPIIENYNKLLISVGEPGKNPAIEQELEKTRLLLRQMGPALVEKYISQLAITDLEQADKVRKYFNETLETTVFKPLETRDEATSLLSKKITERMGINATLTFPFISMLKEMGVSVSVADAMIGGLDGATAQALGKEIAGLSSKNVNSLLRGDPASIHFTAILEVLQGDKQLADIQMSPAKARETFKVVQAVDKTIRQEVASGDFTNADTFTNTRAEIVIAAGKLNRQSGVAPLSNALISLLGTGVSTKPALQKLIDADDADGVVAARGTRAAVGHIISSLQSSPDIKTEYHSVKFNREKGQFEIVADTAAIQARERSDSRNISYVGIGGSPYARPAQKITVPPSLQRAANALNTGLGYLVATKDWDDGAPKGTNMELRRFYGSGEATAAMKKAATNRSNSATPDTNALRGIQEFNKSLESGDFSIPVPDLAGPGGAPIGADGKVDTPVVAKQMIEVAKGHGFNSNLIAGILANVEHESGYDPRAVGDSGTAFGYFQHRKERVQKAIEVIGTHPKDFSPSQAIQFFKYELENPEEAGMTKGQANAILNAKSASEAAMLIQKYYERPAKVDPKRGRTADRIRRGIK